MAHNHQSSCASTKDQAGTVTAAILIIGDEILKVIITAVLLIGYLVVQYISHPFLMSVNYSCIMYNEFIE